VYHVELREFPHNTHAYNLDLERLRATVLDFFVRGEIFELGGQQWIPARTKIAILEGDELPLHALSMGRGWNNARRHGKDVTAELLAAAQADVAPAPTAAADRAGAEREAAVARDILARCAMGPISLAAVWDRAEIAAPQASSGDWLVLAQKAVTQLLSEGRVALRRGEAADSPAIAADEVEAVLRTREAWGSERATALFVHAA
jgi:hypothetical protein